MESWDTHDTLLKLTKLEVEIRIPFHVPLGNYVLKRGSQRCDKLLLTKTHETHTCALEPQTGTSFSGITSV